MSEYVKAVDTVPKNGQVIDIWDVFGNRFIDCTFKAATIGVRAHVVMRDQDICECDQLTFDYVHCWRSAEQMPLRQTSNTNTKN